MVSVNDEMLITAMKALKITPSSEGKVVFDAERLTAFDQIFAKGAEEFKKQVDTKLSQKYVEMYAKKVFCLGITALQTGAIESATQKWKLYKNVNSSSSKSTQTVECNVQESSSPKEPMLDLDEIITSMGIKMSGQNKKDFMKLSPATIQKLGARCIGINPNFIAEYVLQNGKLSHGKIEPTKADWVDGMYRFVQKRDGKLPVKM